jgi:hypothetical protein
VHSPCKIHGSQEVNLEFLASGDTFVFSSGSLVQIWKKVEIRLEGQKPSTKWSIVHEFEYQNKDVRQVITGINLRLSEFKSAVSEK